MKKSILFLLCVLLFGIVSAASADQWGDELYGFSDQYGVYVHGLDGESVYIWFWSEWARQSIMGDLTAPADHVMERPASVPDGKYNLGFAIPEVNAGEATPVKGTVNPTPTSAPLNFMVVCFCRYLVGSSARTDEVSIAVDSCVDDKWCTAYCTGSSFPAGRYFEGFVKQCSLR